MIFRQIFSSLKSHKLLLILLFVFLVKQLLMVAVFPIFQAPDEPAHYSTIQYKAESKKDVLPLITQYKNKQKANLDNAMLSTYDFSEEILNTMTLIETNKVAFHSSKTQTFIRNSSDGQFENEIKNNDWARYIPYKKPAIVAGVPGYYFLPTIIEKYLAQSSIFTRFFTERIFSVVLGFFIVLFIYLSARKIGWDEKISFLLATLVAFQPMFSQSAAIINYDILLIFTFAFFTYGAISSLRDGPNWKNGFIMLFSAVVGILTKLPAMVLWAALIILAIYFARKHFKVSNKIFVLSVLNIFLLIFILANIFFPGNYFVQVFALGSENSQYNSIFQSISKYISATFDRWNWSELSYWGNFGWLDTGISGWIVSVIHFVEMAAILGLIAYFSFSKRIPEFLPQKKFVIFLLGFFLALQGAIRFADWTFFNSNGQVVIGTYGRYFLPVIGIQFMLIAIGLGMLVRKYSIWKNILKVLALGMVLLWTYSVLIIIIPRYYL